MNCPLCKYAFPADLADVAITRHAREHTAGEWQWYVEHQRAREAAEQAHHEQRAASIREDIALAEQWSAAERANPRCASETAAVAGNGHHRCVLNAGHADVHRDDQDPHVGRGWTDDAPKPKTVRDDVASVTS